MKKLAVYLLFVILGVAVLDVVNRLIVETAYANLPSDSELRRSFRYTTDCNAELLILGASLNGGKFLHSLPHCFSVYPLINFS